jgi:hypothetical protein
MKAAIKDCFLNRNSAKEIWPLTKVLFILYWLFKIKSMAYHVPEIDYPKGFCYVFDCNIFFSAYARHFLFILAVTAAILYIFEKFMIPSLVLISLSSIIFFSLTASNGVNHINSFMSGIFISQLIAYIYYAYHKNYEKLEQSRIQFSVQVVAASYTLAALSKLSNGGFNWFMASDGFALQIHKSLLLSFSTTGDPAFLEKSDWLLNFVLQHPGITQFMLLTALLLEFFAFLVLIKNELKVIYGWVLIFMHLGILYLMDIHYFPIHLYLFFVNLPYLIIGPFKYIFNQSRQD